MFLLKKVPKTTWHLNSCLLESSLAAELVKISQTKQPAISKNIFQSNIHF